MHEFALRHYDASIGRFVTTDPYEQFDSPYLAMGNNPVVSFDPDGGYCYDSNGNQIACPSGDDVGDFYDDYRDSETNHINVLNEVVVETDSENTKVNKAYWAEISNSAELLDKIATLRTGKTSSGRAEAFRKEEREAFINNLSRTTEGDSNLSYEPDIIGGGAMDLISGKAAGTIVFKFSQAQKLQWWTKTPDNILTIKEAVSRLSKEYLDLYKKGLKVGAQTGRSGGHGTALKRAGNELIREANKPGVGKELSEALKKAGKQMIEQGKGINHKL